MLPHNRLLALCISLFGLFSILIAQFFRIQITEYDKWDEAARKQHFFLVKEPFKRGRFFTTTSHRRGHPETSLSLVVDVQKHHLYIDPKSIPADQRTLIADQLSNLLQLPLEKKLKLHKQFTHKSRSRKLAMWLNKEMRDSILAWWHPYAKQHRIATNAIYFIDDYQRSYPYGGLLGQVLHTIQPQKNARTSQAIPTGGLELTFNRYLQGKQGKRLLMRSPRHAFEIGEVIAYPENGADIYLTIDHNLQAIAEEELEKGVKNSKAKSGWALMLEPKTGEILALAQYPFFNPSEYQRFFNDPELIEHTRVKAILEAHEPGSIVKPCTLAAGLLANAEAAAKGEPPVFDPEEKVATSIGRFPGRSKLLKDTHIHYFCNMNMGLLKSSNIYMAKVAQKIMERFGKDWYRAVLHDRFGLGQKSGIELPAESAGLLPTPGKKHPNGALEWSGGTPYSLAMGHNVQATSLQMATAYTVFANGGEIVKPTLVRKIVRTRADGSEELLYTHQVEKKKVLERDMVDVLVQAMKYTTKTGGTATRANIWGYTEVGKTSSAEKVINGTYSKKLHLSSFIGFTPLSDPAFILIVAMDEPEHKYIPGVGKNHMGGVCAAPVFREIATRALHYLGIPPDDPYGYPPGDPRYNFEKADWVLEARRLQEIYESWNNKSGKH